MADDIEISSTNLYANGYIVDFPEDGESLLLRDKLVFSGDEKDDWYTVKQGDRLDLIAYNKYSPKRDDASKLWWIIADANNIYNPFDLSAYIGKDLLVPNIEKVLLTI